MNVQGERPILMSPITEGMRDSTNFPSSSRTRRRGTKNASSSSAVIKVVSKVFRLPSSKRPTLTSTSPVNDTSYSNDKNRKIQNRRIQEQQHNKDDRKKIARNNEIEKWIISKNAVPCPHSKICGDLKRCRRNSSTGRGSQQLSQTSRPPMCIAIPNNVTVPEEETNPQHDEHDGYDHDYDDRTLPKDEDTSSLETEGEENSKNSSKVCVLCDDEIVVGDIVSWSRNPKCQHSFHHHCIKEWLMQRRRGNGHDSCPICNEVMLAIDMPENKHRDLKRVNPFPLDCYYCVSHGIINPDPTRLSIIERTTAWNCNTFVVDKIRSLASEVPTRLPTTACNRRRNMKQEDKDTRIPTPLPSTPPSLRQHNADCSDLSSAGSFFGQQQRESPGGSLHNGCSRANNNVIGLDDIDFFSNTYDEEEGADAGMTWSTETFESPSC